MKNVPWFIALVIASVMAFFAVSLSADPAIPGGPRRSVVHEFGFEENRDDGTIGFELGTYDRRQPLVIDPNVLFATYLGRDTDDGVTAIAAPDDGSTGIAGGTEGGLPRESTQPGGSIDGVLILSCPEFLYHDE